MLRFAYSTINWGDTGDLERAFDEIRQSGWRAVELFAHSLDWLGPMPRLLKELGDLKVATSFGVVSVPSDSFQLRKLLNQIDYAAELGAEAFGLVGGSRLRWRPPADAEYSDLARFCETLAKFGQTRNVAVSYHPHVACTIETEAEIDRLMAETTVLKLCLDVSHIALVDEDPIAHFKKYEARTGYVHLKDWALGKFVEMGAGSIDIDFGESLRALEERGYDGWVVVEQSRSDVSPLVSAQRNADYLRGLGYDPGSIG